MFHLLLVVLLVLIKCRAKCGVELSGELKSAERIELKFSLKYLYQCFEILHSAIHPVVGLQYSKIDLGYHDFHHNSIITPF